MLVTKHLPGAYGKHAFKDGTIMVAGELFRIRSRYVPTHVSSASFTPFSSPSWASSARAC